MLRARFGTHPDGINLQAALPLFWELGRNRQSVAVAATRGEVPWATLCVEALEHLQGREHTESGGAAVLNSLPGGVGELVHALTDILGERVRTGVEVQALERRRNRWLVHTDQGIHEAVSVVLACTGTAQAPLVSGLDPELGELLRSIPYAPMAVVSGAWPAGAWGRAPSGMGMVYPLDGPVLASWFTTCLFPDHGPEGEVLVQTLLGGAEHADVVDRSDHELVELTRSALLRSLGRERVEPLDHAVVRHRSALPLLRRGHLGRVRALRAAEARYAGLFFAGPHVYGTGIDHCTDGALQTVNQVVSWIESEASRKHPSGEFLLGAGRAG
jgi:protoporphyrinogen oxidase